MLLAVDVGNTQTALCLYRDSELVDHWRLATERSSTADELGVLLGGLLDFEAVDGICLASTVPVLVREWEALAAKWAHAPLLVVGPGVKTGIPIRYDDPRELGPDRLVNAVAARERYGAPVDRRRLRHVHELRRRLVRGRVRRRSARTGSRDLDGGAVLACGAACQRRLRGAAVGDREDDGQRAAVRPRLRLRRARSTASSAASVASSGSTRRRSRRAGSPISSRPTRRRSSASIRSSRSKGLRLVWELNR